MSVISLRGWTPVWVGNSATGPAVEWSYFGSERFTEPFFEQSVGRLLMNPAHLLFRRRLPLPVLEEVDREMSRVAPSGFIFHMSRCGSTLLGQMLAALPQNIVISEAPPLDQLIFAAIHFHEVARERRLSWLRGAMAGLGQPRHGERHLFVKLDSWHILQLPLLMEAFPGVPWIFLYRDPLDVLISHGLRRGSQMIPGMLSPQVYNFDPPWSPEVGFDAYTAWVLEKICRAAIDQAGLGRGRMVHYAELPQVVRSLCSGHFGVDFSDEDYARMERATQSHSKHPRVPYVDETVQRRREADPKLIALTEARLAGPYAELEALRNGQPAWSRP